MEFQDILQLVPLAGAFIWSGGLQVRQSNLKEKQQEIEVKLVNLENKIDTLEVFGADIREIKTNMQWLMNNQKEMKKKLEAIRKP